MLLEPDNKPANTSCIHSYKISMTWGVWPVQIVPRWIWGPYAARAWPCWEWICSFGALCSQNLLTWLSESWTFQTLVPVVSQYQFQSYVKMNAKYLTLSSWVVPSPKLHWSHALNLLPLHWQMTDDRCLVQPGKCTNSHWAARCSWLLWRPICA